MSINHTLPLTCKRDGCMCICTDTLLTPQLKSPRVDKLNMHFGTSCAVLGHTSACLHDSGCENNYYAVKYSTKD